ncbi:heat shock protein 70KD (nucleomorph) [Lotharella oceanica]|uniref:Heat shock protein 70KD n=1 Tax=Lotharella oceanica TaxID=641309 RepID=A0A060DB26_9EUKA|nr:heat shock protein 70KD [Lotharella oceanica]AIB09699.1 heat shock protein 70KD [Lotharella oceanica]AIB09714.1 heat shock protein 70KD [Lotharella oceanica]AIB09902.1 heat shock protein 70KD [Lotharella oceanica]AIB09917.1 heat shock protein 70KD [Lotharella oceanica]
MVCVRSMSYSRIVACNFMFGTPRRSRLSYNAEPSEVLGIDLGTTYSCVGLWINSKVELFYNETGNRTTPSVVAFDDKERLVGGAAKNQAIINPENTIYDLMRTFGRKFSDEAVQHDAKSWPFKIARGPDDKILIKVVYKGENKEYRPEELISMLLLTLKNIAEVRLGYVLSKCCIAVPFYLNTTQRSAVKDAGKLAGLDVVRIINKPAAACMAYGFHRKREGRSRRNILIYNLGCRSICASILTIDGGVVRARATSGDTHLGGEDFDRRLTEHFLDEFVTKHPDLSGIKEEYRSRKRLKSALERAKRTISTKSATKVELDALYEGMDYTFTLTRARFEELCKDLIESLIKPVQDVIVAAKVNKGELDDIVLVGGYTRIPAVREVLEGAFPGRHVSECVGMGMGMGK